MTELQNLNLQLFRVNNFEEILHKTHIAVNHTLCHNMAVCWCVLHFNRCT